jgi:hypothetical protein
MTLVPYSPDGLDQLSLRVLDLCARLRQLARLSRETELAEVELHDRKALEWLDKLDEWLLRAEADVQLAVNKNKGKRLADKTQSTRGSRSARGKQMP